LAGEELLGVDLVLLDADAAGVASHYLKNLRPMTADHRVLLERAANDLDRVRSELPNDVAIAYFDRLRKLVSYFLDTR
jgi:hypothetical protein